MNAAYLTALAGIAGVLLGTLGSGVMQWLAERRRERAQARVAAGYIRAELANAELTLKTAKETGYWWPPELAPSFSAWEQRGPALLTGAATRGGRLHTAVLAVKGLDASADRAYKELDVAGRRLERAQASGDKAGEVAAAKDVKAAEADTKLSDEQRQQIDRAVSTVQTALRDVPSEDLPPWVRKAIPLAALVVVAAAIAYGVVAEVHNYERATVTTKEVADAVRIVRGAAEASCSPVKDVENAFSCELTYVEPDPPPPAVPKCSLANTTASLPASARTMASTKQLFALTSGTEPACKVEVLTDDSVDVSPRKFFTDAFTRVVVNATTAGARNVLSSKWKADHEPVVTGKVKTG